MQDEIALAREFRCRRGAGASSTVSGPVAVLVGSSFARSVLLLIAAFALVGCASRVPVVQVVEVLVEADDPAWGGPLQCEATNSAGSWPFSAPGSVSVVSSHSPLQISCGTPAGAAVAPSTTALAIDAAAREGARKGTSSGAKVGTGAGVALGVAAAPVMGPAFAVLLVVGSAMRGAQIGGAVGAIRSGGEIQYPSPILLRVKAAAPLERPPG
jgi:hypothetical protein